MAIQNSSTAMTAQPGACCPLKRARASAGEPDERMLPGAYGYLASAEPARDPYYHQSRLAQAQMADLALDLHVDARTAERIRELHAQKAHAVAVENYDEAKRLKGCIDRLKQLGQKIAQLEARKMVRILEHVAAEHSVPGILIRIALVAGGLQMALTLGIHLSRSL